jgi:hypothetical protein
MLISSVTSFAPISSIKVFLVYFAFILGFYLTVNAVKSKKQLYSLITIMLFAGAAVAIYGIYLANDKTTVFTIVFAAVNLLTWILQLGFEILSSYVELQFALVVEGLKMDAEALTKPIRSVEGALNKVFGKDSEEMPLAADAEKRRAILSKKAELIKEEKRSRKAETKLGRLKKKIKELSLFKKGEKEE